MSLRLGSSILELSVLAMINRYFSLAFLFIRYTFFAQQCIQSIQSCQIHYRAVAIKAPQDDKNSDDQSSPSNVFGPLWLQAAMFTGMIFAV